MKYGFIGCGNMGGALAEAVAKVVSPQEIGMSGGKTNKAADAAARLGATLSTNREIASQCQYIFLGVKPAVVPVVLDEIADLLAERAGEVTVVSMAAGLTIEELSRQTAGAPVVRIMPNTPVSVGKGIILYTASENVTEDSLAELRQALSAAGRVDELPEHQMNAGMALTGCGPAYVYMFMEALADGAVSCGLPRDKAIKYAAETIRGAAELALQSGQHPGELKDAVTSPGGATIKGVYALEKGGMRGAVIEAVQKSCGK